MRLKDKVALITGAARGIGAAEARLFAREGARVVICDVLEAEGRQVEAEINEAGSQCLFVTLDVTQELEWQSAVQAAVSRFGKLDILVNNAAIPSTRHPDGRPFSIEELSGEQWDRVMEVNAKGVFLGTKYAIPELRKAGGGSIVNTASVAALIGTSINSYAASKGAVRAFTRATAIQHAREGIRANAVFPGGIDTPMGQYRINNPEFQRHAEAHIPMGRTGRPEEVAYGVLFLASDESSYMTGSEMVIDGGATAY